MAPSTFIKPKERAQNLLIRQQQKRSILDFLQSDARSLIGEVSGRDRQKLDEYFSSVRDIELSPPALNRVEMFRIAVYRKAVFRIDWQMCNVQVNRRRRSGFPTRLASKQMFA